MYDRLAEEEEETEMEHARVMAVMEREREERLDELDRQVFTVRQSRVHNFPIIMLIQSKKFPSVFFSFSSC